MGCQRYCLQRDPNNRPVEKKIVWSSDSTLIGKGERVWQVRKKKTHLEGVIETEPMPNFMRGGLPLVKILPRCAWERAVSYQHPIELGLPEVEGRHRCSSK